MNLVQGPPRLPEPWSRLPEAGGGLAPVWVDFPRERKRRVKEEAKVVTPRHW